MQSPTRRAVVRTSTLALTGAALAGPVTIAAANALRPGPPAGGHAAARGSRAAESSAAPEPEAFDEMYLGRHMEGRPAAGRHGGHSGHGASGPPADEPGGHVEYVVRVDDDDLHVMQNADGTWISVVNHYEKYRTPRDAARAAVRELRGASLVPVTV
ncbi:tyrosinase family oxidase copper chaperone [Streptomyces sp. HNM0645]|uniref:apotyrosinase chaperone MelC1 n=1 Tax=Streptomyces sp. HNM0645 TaxID=2782343 RepID=UPI0024B7AA28|nr:tyrosinase family oxidase copper chaperone [Streptomyces sp. HNM0645]MDI9887111.1 tyrosinase family oxidase copper chaperone [Streptomyces sp. HNM0645]